MGFLNNTKDRQRRQKQWTELRKDPRPTPLATFVRSCFAADDSELANEVLDFAIDVFPDSEDLLRMRALLRSAAAEERLRMTKDRLTKDRSSAAFLELADAYVSLDRSEDGMRVLRDLVDEHGECATALSWLGRLRLERFRESLSSVDGAAARDLLLRAIAADPDALKPRMLLAQLYFVVGAKTQARTELASLLQICPEYQLAQETFAALGDEDKEARLEDIDSKFVEVEERMELAATLPGEESRGELFIDPEAVAEELERVSSEIGIDQAAPYSIRGTHEAENRRKGDPTLLLSQVATELGSFAEVAARHMDLGSATGLVIEGDAGAMLMEQRRGQGVAAVLASDHDGVDEALVSVRDALQRLLRGGSCATS